MGSPPGNPQRATKLLRLSAFLKTREGEIAEGKLPGIHFDKVTFEELAKDFITNYRVNAGDTFTKAERSVKYLKESIWRDEGYRYHHCQG